MSYLHFVATHESFRLLPESTQKEIARVIEEETLSARLTARVVINELEEALIKSRGAGAAQTQEY